MTSKRMFYIMIGVLVLLFAAVIGGTYVANTQLRNQSDKLVGYKTQNAVLAEEQAGLVKAKKDVATYSPLAAIAKTVVPQDKDQAKAVREIVGIAAASGITPTSITFPVSTLGLGLSGATGGTTSSPATSSLSKPSLSQLTPVKGITGVYNLPITIQLDSSSPVPYSKFIDFLGRLEQNRRTAQVSSVILQPNTNNHNLVSFTLTVDEFIKP